MLPIDPLVDNIDTSLEEVYKKIIPEIEEARIATGYFYLSGFDLYNYFANRCSFESRHANHFTNRPIFEIV